MASLPEPPPNVPRIVEVLDPGARQYAVYVRMPTNLAAKWPDKPWGTSIAEIGLSAKDAEQYAGYTLVDIEPMKGSPDLYWVFQKLDGPVWTTKSQGQESLIPQKYRRLVTSTRTKQEVAPGTQPSAITGGVVQSVVEQQDNTGKAIKVDTTETIDTNATPLAGERFAPDGTVLAVSESLVNEGAASDKGLNVATSEVDPTGDGKAVKQTQTAKRRKSDDSGVEDGWPKKQVKSIGTENLTPQKFRGQMVASVMSEQVALPAANVDDIPAPSLPGTPDGTTKVEHEKVNDWRYEKRVTKEVVDTNAAPLVGEELNKYGTISTVTEQLVSDSEDLPSPTHLILAASDSPIGNGKSIRQIEQVEAFPVLTGYETNKALNAPVKYTEEVVAASAVPANHDDPLVEYQPIDALKSMKRSKVVPVAALDNYHLSFPVRIDLSNLPRELISVGVVWNQQSSIGTQDYAFSRTAAGDSWSLSGDSSDRASSSAAITADIRLRYRDVASNNLYGEKHLFYIPLDQATQAGILLKLKNLLGLTGTNAVKMWPVFHPESETITITSQSISVAANVSAGMSASWSNGGYKSKGWEKGESDDFSANLSTQSVQIPPCIHPAISLTGGTYKTQPVAAVGFLQMYHTSVGQITATKTKSGNATCEVYPSTLPAVRGQATIPTSGYYLMDMDVAPYDWDYAVVSAVVFNAANLA